MSSGTTSTWDGDNAQATIAFALLVAVMVVTPIFRAGATPLAALANQLLAVALLVVVLWSPERILLRTHQAVAILALCLLPAMYLLPLPPSLAEWLPGRDLYREAGALLPATTPHASPTLAIVPGRTAAAVLALLLPVSVFIAVRLLRPKQIEVVVGVVVAVAALQALLGLLQYGSAQSGGTPLTVEGAHQLSAVGTYANRNHLAGLIEMVLPVSLGWLFFGLDRVRSASSQKISRVRQGGDQALRASHVALASALVALLLVVGVIFTQSRAGIALALSGVVLGAVVFSHHVGRKTSLRPVFMIIALASVAAFGLGLAPVINRFTVAAVENDLRWDVFQATWHGLIELFPVGSGLQGFATVFPTYQTLELGASFINRAHNDYLELVFDLGIVGVTLIGAASVLFLTNGARLITQRQYDRFTFIQIGAVIGVLMLCVHELVDYNLATPANQVVFALLCAIVLYPKNYPIQPSLNPWHRKEAELDPLALPEPGTAEVSPPTDQIKNPFLDGSSEKRGTLDGLGGHAVSVAGRAKAAPHAIQSSIPSPQRLQPKM